MFWAVNVVCWFRLGVPPVFKLHRAVFSADAVPNLIFVITRWVALESSRRIGVLVEDN